MSRQFKKAVVEEADYTPEQHLVAAVGEFKRLEAANQSYIDRMYNTLSSPFKISSKPCEADRQAVLRCYQELVHDPAGPAEDGAASGTQTLPRWEKEAWQLPLHMCHALAMAYGQCVETKTLSEHLALASSFESKRIAAQARAVEEMKANERAGVAADAAAAAAAAAEALARTSSS